MPASVPAAPGNDPGDPAHGKVPALLPDHLDGFADQEIAEHLIDFTGGERDIE